MPAFRVLHIARFATPLEKRLGADGQPMMGTEIVFSRLRHPRTNEETIIEAEEPADALALIKRRLPHLIHALAVEPVWQPNP